MRRQLPYGYLHRRQRSPIANANKIKLLTIAIDAFSMKGYSSVSIRDISREAR